jgi:hypothetical protein
VNPIVYNGDGGYLSKDDIIKSMAAEIEMLREQLRVSNEMKFTYMDENRELKAEVTRLAHSREHWIAKHDRAYAVAMHNERVIARLEDSITRGAITPDAHPHE